MHFTEGMAAFTEAGRWLGCTKLDPCMLYYRPLYYEITSLYSCSDSFHTSDHDITFKSMCSKYLKLEWRKGNLRSARAVALTSTRKSEFCTNWLDYFSMSWVHCDLFYAQTWRFQHSIPYFRWRSTQLRRNLGGEYISACCSRHRVRRRAQSGTRPGFPLRARAPFCAVNVSRR